LEMVPTFGLRDHCTLRLDVPCTSAEKLADCPARTVIEAGLIETETLEPDVVPVPIVGLLGGLPGAGDGFGAGDEPHVGVGLEGVPVGPDGVVGVGLMESGADM
jgi:hypothetical protein